MQWAKKQTGFTIVELLIVVVVIAILAAITIVAYNGISQRAKDSTSQNAAAQAARKMATYSVDNADLYPVDEPTFLTYANLQDSGLGTTSASGYQYTVSSDRKTYCLTTTTNSISYFTTSTNQTPVKGSCPGHGANGVSAITNLLTNTSVELNTANLLNIGNTADRSITRTQVSDAKDGAYVLRLTVGPSGGVSGYGSESGSLQPGRYTGSLWIRSNKALNVQPYFEGSAGRTNISSQGANLTPGVWFRIRQTVDVTSAGTLKVGFLAGGNGTLAQNDYVDIDAFLLTAGDTLYNFSDGSSLNWVWNGTANGSTSTGQPL